MVEQKPASPMESQPEQQMNAEQVLASFGRTFHLAWWLLPRRMRMDVAELYAFCRRMDDLADEVAGEDGARSRNQLARAIQVLDEDPLGDEAAALGWPVKLEARFPGISKVAVHLIQSLAADAGPCRIATQAELQHYAFGVAGTVGLMMCRILGAPPAGAAAASHLGIAMQLTNIARDVQKDLRRDRIYLPAEWITPGDVASAVSSGNPAPLMTAMQRLLALAESFYANAATGMHYLPWRARVSILAAVACYREIGVVVERDIAASWQCRPIVSGSRKATLVLHAFAYSFHVDRHWYSRFMPMAKPVAATVPHGEQASSTISDKP